MAICILIPASAFKLVTNVCCVYLQQEAQVSRRLISFYLQIAQTLTSKKSTVTLQTEGSDTAKAKGSASFRPV
jgi:hypothetical protein